MQNNPAPAGVGAATPADASRRGLRGALAQFPTGVVIATAATTDGALLGMTLNSFTSVSLDPPLVLFCIDRRSLGLSAWERAPGYALNVLAEHQGQLSNRFARAGVEKWAGTAFVSGLHGAPLLEGAVARFECRAERRLDGGDHVIFLGLVERHGSAAERSALVFHRGRYGAVADVAAPAPAAELSCWPLPIHY
jgi:flavin reductase (DIM6/NTAB) family NADH-FMN oxidoreductase RutF